MRFSKLPKFLFRLMRVPPRLAYKIGLGPVLGGLVLLLTTRGRKTGALHVTPLQVEEEDGVYYMGSARGDQADWYRNVLADPHVNVHIGGRSFHGLAYSITDPDEVVNFLRLRLKRHPRMVGVILRAQGAGRDLDQRWLQQYASDVAVVAIYPRGLRETAPSEEAAEAGDHPHDAEGLQQ